jgi:hypothetical protein
MKVESNGNNASSSLFSTMREEFVHSVYEDLQDYIFRRFNSPSIVYIREDPNTVRPCFPRDAQNRYRGFCEFCKTVRTIFGGDQEKGTFSLCVEREIAYIEAGIRAEDNGEPWNWQWRQCHMGLLDYFAPIRSLEKNDGTAPILAVLMFGHFREEGSVALADIEKRIREIVTGTEGDSYLAALTKEEREEKATALRRLIPTIPELTNERRNELTQAMEETVKLVALIATHTPRAGTLHDGDCFIRDLHFELGDVRVTEQIFRKSLEKGLEEIRTYLEIDSAAIYTSVQRGYGFLERQAGTPDGARLHTEMNVPSLSQFRELTEYSGIALGREHAPSHWLDPQSTLDAQNGIYFAGETVNGDLILIGFGYKGKLPSSFERAVLIEAVQEKLLPFIKETVLTLDLDRLMEEVGHLLGRTCRKARTGYDHIQDVLENPYIKNETIAPAVKNLKKAETAIGEVIDRLHLIHHNFYAFRKVRAEETHPAGPVDVAALFEVPPIFWTVAK